MLSITLFGILLTAVTVALHTAGTVAFIRYSKHRFRVRQVKPAEFRLLEMCRVIGIVAAVLLILHLAEVLLWAFAYYTIPDIHTPSTIEECIYFSMVTFTTLGYGDIVIGSSWRLFSGIQAMAGMLVFGWSSALLFAAMNFVAGFSKFHSVGADDLD